MSATTTLRMIDEIGATASRLEKEKLLGSLMQDAIGKFAVKWAYDPFITFGLTPARQDSVSGLTIAFRPELVEKMLTELAQRKLTGNAAQREVAEVMMALDNDGAEILFRILSKDLKCGIAATTINSVEPGFIPVFAVMRAHKFEEKRIKKWPQIIEPKLDGYRYTFLCRDGNGGFFSRSGIRQDAADHLVEPMIATALAALKSASVADVISSKSIAGDRASLSFMADGEAIVDGSFAETGALRRKGQTADGLVFHIFDIMSYVDFDAIGSVGWPYKKRRALVEEFVSHSTSPAITKTPRYYANSHDEIHQLYGQFRARGLEGAMVKNPEGLYDKKKSHGWLKIKAEESEDLPIVGFFNGEAGTKYENMLGGAIVLYGNVEVRVGGGWSDEQRQELWEDWKHDAAILGINPQVGFKPGCSPKDPFTPDLKFLGRLIEVLYHEITPDGSLRHPRFRRFRDDKANEVESKEAA